MGVISYAKSRRMTLGARTLIGRSRTCPIRIAHAQVSAEHACIFWHHDAWYVRDLASTNGTWVNAERLDAGARRELRVGAVVAVGAMADSHTIAVADASAPGLRGLDLRGGPAVLGVADLLYLPSESEPLVTVFDDGARWVADSEGVVQPVDDHQVLTVGGRPWRLELPPRTGDEPLETTETVGSMSLEACQLRFRVSRDEEFVELTVIAGGTELALAARTFQYLLLTLARRRLADIASGAPPGEDGWMYADELASALGTSKSKVNLDVCRARQQLAAAGVSGAGRIVERRTSSHQIRIGVADIEVCPIVQ